MHTHQTSSASTSHSAPNWQISQVEVSFCPASAEPSPPGRDRKIQRKRHKTYFNHHFRLSHFTRLNPRRNKSPVTITLPLMMQLWPWEFSLGRLKCIYILSYPAVIPPKPPPSSLLPLPLFSPLLSYSSPESHLSFPISPVISLWILSFISFADFLASRVQRISAVPVSALWRLRDPECAYHTSSAAKGERKEWGGGSNLANLKLHSPTTEDSSSLCELSRFFSFPPRPSSPLESSIFKLTRGPGGQRRRGRQRGGT